MALDPTPTPEVESEWDERRRYRRSPDLLFLHILHHAVNALLCGHMGAVDQRVGCGVEVLAAIEKQELGI